MPTPADTKEMVLVTGASSGIGRALALEFAQKGYPLFLVARNTAALTDLATECEKKYGVAASVYTCDLGDWEETSKMLVHLTDQKIDIGILVNNAGFGIHGAFSENDLGEEMQLVNLQLGALLFLTKALLPRMIAHKAGGILNVSSVYAYTPVPFQSVYAACKAFMLSFSESLSTELAGSGVAVTTLCPGITTTEFRQRAGMKEKNSKFALTPESVAKIGVAAFLKGKRTAVPGWPNRVFVTLMRHLPSRLLPALMKGINQLRGVNVRAEVG